MEMERWFKDSEKVFLDGGMQKGLVRKFDGKTSDESGTEVLIETGNRIGRVFLKNSGVMEVEVTDSLNDVTLSYEYIEVEINGDPNNYLQDFFFSMGLTGSTGCSCNCS